MGAGPFLISVCSLFIKPLDYSLFHNSRGNGSTKKTAKMYDPMHSGNLRLSNPQNHQLEHPYRKQVVHKEQRLYTTPR